MIDLIEIGLLLYIIYFIRKEASENAKYIHEILSTYYKGVLKALNKNERG